MTHNHQVVSASTLALTKAEEAANLKTALLEQANTKISMLEDQYATTQKNHQEVIADLAVKFLKILEREDDSVSAAVAQCSIIIAMVSKISQVIISTITSTR